MKKAALYFCILLISILTPFFKAGAQDAFSMATDFFVDGVPKYASAMHYPDMEGSPYLYDGWAPGEAVLSDGKAYKNLYLKYDEVQGTVIFKYAMTDSAMAFVNPAVEFRFTYITDNKIHNAHFLNGFDPIGDASVATFYQVLANGNTKLLKSTVKKVLKVTEFNSSAVNRRVDENTFYYLAKGKHPVRIKNDNKAVLTALSDKADKIKQYIADNKLNAKDDDDFAKIIAFYNAIN